MLIFPRLTLKFWLINMKALLKHCKKNKIWPKLYHVLDLFLWTCSWSGVVPRMIENQFIDQQRVWILYRAVSRFTFWSFLVWNVGPCKYYRACFFLKKHETRTLGFMHIDYNYNWLQWQMILMYKWVSLSLNICSKLFGFWFCSITMKQQAVRLTLGIL